MQVTDEVSEFVDLSLFPVFHSSTSTSSIEKNAFGFEKLSAMNAEAADTLQKTIALIEGSGAVIVLVYGISLMLLPKLIHARLPEITIAFMFNSAFPDGELYRTIPKRTELLLGLLGGANLVITGDEKDIDHVKEAATLLLGLDCSKDVIVCGDVRCRIVCMPLVEKSISKPNGDLQEEKESMLLEIGKGVAEESKLHIVVAVDDAIDATRGIILKLLAIEDLLETHKELRGSLIFIYLLGAASIQGTRHIASATLVDKISEAVSQINGKFSSPTWTPILLIRSQLPIEKKLALFSICKAGLFTTLRDLVPQSLSCFISANAGAQFPAVAIVSEFSGSSSRLSSALLVNPVDTRSTARSLFRAISCEKEERLQRHDDLSKWLEEHCAKQWAIRFMTCARIAQEAEQKRRQLTKLDTDQVLSAYSTFQKRLIFISGWNTLTPSHASGDLEFEAPSDSLRMSLAQLSADPLNAVWLATAGIPAATLDAWLGDIPIGLVGENGFWLRWPPLPQNKLGDQADGLSLSIAQRKASEESSTRLDNEHLQRHKFLLQSFSSRNASSWDKCLGTSENLDWLVETVEIMRYFTERSPGASLQVLESSAIFSFAGADIEFGQLQARDLLIHLNSMLHSSTARATLSQARKTVTVGLKSNTSGHLLSHLLKSYEENQSSANETTAPYFDFFLGLCDDEIDPAVDSASHFPLARNFSVSVGRSAVSGSKYFLESPEQAAALLSQLGVSQLDVKK